MPNSKKYKLQDGMFVIRRQTYERNFTEDEMFVQANNLKLFAFYRTFFKGLMLQDVPVLQVNGKDVTEYEMDDVSEYNTDWDSINITNDSVVDNADNTAGDNSGDGECEQCIDKYRHYNRTTGRRIPGRYWYWRNR